MEGWINGDSVKVIPNFDKMFETIFYVIYPNITEEIKEKLVKEFQQLNNNQRFKLLTGIIDPNTGDFTEKFNTLIKNDEDIVTWGIENKYQSSENWIKLVEELGKLQVHSLTVVNVEELFGLIGDKLRTLNKIVETDRKINLESTGGGNGMHKKYLKYKQKYLKLQKKN